VLPNAVFLCSLALTKTDETLERGSNRGKCGVSESLAMGTGTQAGRLCYFSLGLSSTLVTDPTCAYGDGARAYCRIGF
jgi:hypothetical protein